MLSESRCQVGTTLQMQHVLMGVLYFGSHTTIWKHTNQLHIPQLDPVHYGLVRDDSSNLTIVISPRIQDYTFLFDYSRCLPHS